MEPKTHDYDVHSIKVLDGLEGVRKRPAMYIGSTGKEGLHHLAMEVINNSVDEALAGFCTKIHVTINKDGSLTVEDNGRGIPTEIHPQFNKPGVEIVLTKLHAGGKFDHKIYPISGGLHGVGVSVVNALSEELIVEIKRNSKIYWQKYQRGKPVTELQVKGTCKPEETGTKITFKPDKEIFSTTTFDYELLATKLRELAFLNPGLLFILESERDKKKESFRYENGLQDFVKWLNKTRNPLHRPIYLKKKHNDCIVEVAMQYTDSYQENIFSFVNTINTIEGGTHVAGFKTALTRVFNDYAKKNKILKEEEKLEGEDTREGLTAIISLHVRDPQFEGQTKTKLGNTEVKGIVDSVVTEQLSQFLEENPSVAKIIMTKIMQAFHARVAAKKAKELVRRKSAFSAGLLPGKLADCSSSSLEKTELFIVEGESAAGSSKQARNKEFQAILPLRGKILNVEKANPHKIFENEEIAALATAIGTGIGENFDIKKLRYGRIIIMCDADVDGQHIKTLLLTFFFRFMPSLIESKRIFIALPPLYRIRKGSQNIYVYSDEELEKQLKKLGNAEVQRFKGLGEMNPEQLWETCMNPKTRILKLVTIEDAIEADRIFSILMGEAVEPRKQFIIQHAKMASLDI